MRWVLFSLFRLGFALGFAAALFVLPLAVGYAIARPASTSVIWVVFPGHGLHESDLGVLAFGLGCWSMALLGFARMVRWRP